MISIDLNSISTENVNWKALVEQALAGETIAIKKSGLTVAHIAPVKVETPTNTQQNKRQAGLLAGKQLDPAFFEPLDAQELELW